MRLYLINEFSEEWGPGSSPSVQTHVFSTPEKRADFMADWNANNESMPSRERDDSDPNKFHAKDWTYWLEEAEKETDQVFYYGGLWKSY